LSNWEKEGLVVGPSSFKKTMHSKIQKNPSGFGFRDNCYGISNTWYLFGGVGQWGGNIAPLIFGAWHVSSGKQECDWRTNSGPTRRAPSGALALGLFDYCLRFINVL
jgi:hypothetical protein